MRQRALCAVFFLALARCGNEPPTVHLTSLQLNEGPAPVVEVHGEGVGPLFDVDHGVWLDPAWQLELRGSRGTLLAPATQERGTEWQGAFAGLGPGSYAVALLGAQGQRYELPEGLSVGPWPAQGVWTPRRTTAQQRSLVRVNVQLFNHSRCAVDDVALRLEFEQLSATASLRLTPEAVGPLRIAPQSMGAWDFHATLSDAVPTGPVSVELDGTATYTGSDGCTAVTQVQASDGLWTVVPAPVDGVAIDALSVTPGTLHGTGVVELRVTVSNTTDQDVGFDQISLVSEPPGATLTHGASQAAIPRNSQTVWTLTAEASAPAEGSTTYVLSVQLRAHGLDQTQYAAGSRGPYVQLTVSNQ